MIILLFALSVNLFSQEIKNTTKSGKPLDMELIMKNFERGLNSENNGLSMSVVEQIGRYKMTNFENNLIEMLKDEADEKNREIIALSLFQLGSLKSIVALRNSLEDSNNFKYDKFCNCLLNKYNEYDNLRTEYFEDLVVNIHDTK